MIIETIVVSVLISGVLVLGWTYVVEYSYNRWFRKSYKEKKDPVEYTPIKKTETIIDKGNDLFDLPTEEFPDLPEYEEEENPDLITIVVPEIKITTGIIIKDKKYE